MTDAEWKDIIREYRKQGPDADQNSGSDYCIEGGELFIRIGTQQHYVVRSGHADKA